MKNKKTKADETEILIKNVRIQFCKKFGWTEEYYCDKEFKKAFLWIDFHQLPENLTYSKTFWNWWKLKSAHINEESIIRGELQQVHFNEIRPYPQTLDQMYHESLATIA